MATSTVELTDPIWPNTFSSHFGASLSTSSRYGCRKLLFLCLLVDDLWIKCAGLVHREGGSRLLWVRGLASVMVDAFLSSTFRAGCPMGDMLPLIDLPVIGASNSRWPEKMSSIFISTIENPDLFRVGAPVFQSLLVDSVCRIPLILLLCCVDVLF